MAETMQPAEYAANCFREMAARLGVKASVTGTGEGKRIVLSVETDQPGHLIGRRGRNLNNLDYLLNRILAGKYDQQVRAKIDVKGGEEMEGKGGAESADGERNQRGPARKGQKKVGPGAGEGDTERLRRLALDAAKEVKRWGDSKTIGPFTTPERKIIHSTLQDDADVRTESGEELAGRRKKVTILPADHEESG